VRTSKVPTLEVGTLEVEGYPSPKANPANPVFLMNFLRLLIKK
jgi:hypothetical protein